MNATQFHKIAKALADPRRFEILRMIAATGESCCGAIADEIPVAQPTISHHLKELANAGLIQARKQGQHCYYHLQAEVLDSYIQELRQIKPDDRSA
jgi:ArsR family transcriptional regulator, arsenate/arsenite/antimonite-responsive transcriptional repressor